MTLNEFLNYLDDLPADSDLVFHSEGREISGGYHVTEFKLARIDSVDCGARTSAWTEATMQLLDGTGRDHMKLGKFFAIATKSVETIPTLDQVTLGVEYAPENTGMRIFDLDVPEQQNGRVMVHLSGRGAMCKPRVDFAAEAASVETAQSEQSSCCSPARSGCC